MKTFEKARFLKDNKALLALDKEISLLRQMDHVYIMKLYEVYENELYVHLVLEYLAGGELHEHIRRRKKYSEVEARKLMRCVLEGLVYCHERQIIHRDLKPENLMFRSGRSDAVLKLADFGLATKMDGDPETQRCGSAGYVAPELLHGFAYNTQVDVFSAGVILYKLYFRGSYR